MNERIFEKRSGQLVFANGKGEVPVRAKALFPWGNPYQFISLRNDKDEEVFLIDDVANLVASVRERIVKHVRDNIFIFEIKKIEAINEGIEFRTFEVEVESGKRTFHTRLDTWPKRMPNGGIVITDVAGDLYRFPKRKDLDKKQIKLLAPIIE